MRVAACRPSRSPGPAPATAAGSLHGHERRGRHRSGLVLGLAGFVAAGTGSADVFGILGVNALHNVIHIVVFGAIWIWAALRGPAIAKTANLLLGAALLLICLLGLVGGLGWLNIGSGVGEAHFWLTLVTGALGVYFGTAGAELGGRPRTA